MLNPMRVNYDVSVFPFLFRRFILPRIWSMSTDCLSMRFLYLYLYGTRLSNHRHNRLICHNHTHTQPSILYWYWFFCYYLPMVILVCISIILVCKGPPRYERIKFISFSFFIFSFFLYYSVFLFITIKTHWFALFIHYDEASTTLRMIYL